MITVVHCGSPTQVFDDLNDDPELLHLHITDCMATMGCMNAYRAADMVVVLSPDIADVFANAGLSKMDVHKLLREKAGRRVGQLKHGRLYGWVTKVDLNDDNCFVPSVQEPGRLYLIVAGGRGGAADLVMHGWNESAQGVSIVYDV